MPSQKSILKHAQRDEVALVKADIPITVLMSVFNAERYLSFAIQSILDQSFSNFEFLIIDDGSTDASKEIIASYNDPRIRYVKSEINLNLCRSLAKGVTLARGEFIARMDADDVAHSQRLERQLSTMRIRPDLNLLGTNVRCIDENNKIIGYPKVTSDPLNLRWSLFFRNCFNHPTVMIRTAALRKSGLNYGVVPASIADYLRDGLGGIGDEDYLLFGLLSLHGRVANIDEVLLDYRIHKESLTAVFLEKQNQQSKQISGALRSMYSERKDQHDSVDNPQESFSFKTGPSLELDRINVIAQRMIQEFKDPSSQRRIEFRRKLYLAIFTEDRQSTITRLLFGLKMICQLRSTKSEDFLDLIKYMLGARFLVFFKRYLSF